MDLKRVYGLQALPPNIQDMIKTLARASLVLPNDRMVYLKHSAEIQDLLARSTTETVRLAVVEFWAGIAREHLNASRLQGALSALSAHGPSLSCTRRIELEICHLKAMFAKSAYDFGNVLETLADFLYDDGSGEAAFLIAETILKARTVIEPNENNIKPYDYMVQQIHRLEKMILNSTTISPLACIAREFLGGDPTTATDPDVLPPIARRFIQARREEHCVSVRLRLAWLSTAEEWFQSVLKNGTSRGIVGFSMHRDRVFSTIRTRIKEHERKHPSRIILAMASPSINTICSDTKLDMLWPQRVIDGNTRDVLRTIFDQMYPTVESDDEDDPVVDRPDTPTTESNGSDAPTT